MRMMMMMTMMKKRVLFERKYFQECFGLSFLVAVRTVRSDLTFDRVQIDRKSKRKEKRTISIDRRSSDERI
jgi:hypothetical protein